MVTRIIITKQADPAEIMRQVLPKMTNLGNAIGRRMQRLVPKRSWALHDTITAETEASGGTVTTTVGFGGGIVDYGLHVERGTSRMAAQPFARPALLQSRAGDLDFSGGSPSRHGVAVARPSRRTR
jgi:hypothetical protein